MMIVGDSIVIITYYLFSLHHTKQLPLMEELFGNMYLKNNVILINNPAWPWKQIRTYPYFILKIFC